MTEKNNIFELLQEKSDEALQRARRGVIIQGGAIGDCILTLPLAGFLKKVLKLGAIDIFGKTEYIDFFPGRTCIDGIRSLDSIELHRLFVNSGDFEVTEHDSLVQTFDDYSWIFSFLGGPDSDFEKNLIYAVHSARSSEIISLSLKPPLDFSEHITKFYIDQFLNQCQHSITDSEINLSDALIKPNSSDFQTGSELLAANQIDHNSGIVIISPGSGGIHKCWSLANFIAVAKKLISKGYEVLFILGPAEKERFSRAAVAAIEETSICLSDLSLSQVLGLLSWADIFIGNDSGITHLAAVLGVKTIALFGPTNSAVYRPIGPDVTVFQAEQHGFTDAPSQNLQNQVADAVLKSG